MNVRQGMLVRELLDATEFKTCDWLADVLGCSEKTVRTDIKALDAYLESAGLKARIASKPGAGIRLAPTSAERSRLERLLDENEVSMRPKLERLCQELVVLACSPGPHTIESLARSLYANKQQVQSDLKIWQRALDPHGIAVVLDRSVSLEGEEKDIRMFVLLFLASFPPRAIAHRIEPLIAGGSVYDEEFFERIADGAQQAMDVRFSSNGRRHMIIYAKIMVARVRMGCCVECYQGVRPLIPYVVGLELRYRRHFGIELSASELAYVQDLYDCCTWQWSSTLIDAYEPHERASALMVEIVGALEDDFGAPVPDSYRKPLGITIERGLVRRACAISSPNPNETTIKYDHMDNFCLITSTLGHLRSLEAAALYGSDYARIALILLDYAQQANPSRTYRVGLVANCGIDLVLYGKRRIEELVPAADIVGIVSEDEVVELDRLGGALAERFDLLISFEPLAISFPNVMISSKVDEQDLRRIVVSLPLRGGRLGARTDLPWYEHDVETAPVPSENDLGSRLRSHVLESLSRAGVVSGSREHLAWLFDTVAVTKGRTLIVPFCDRQVVRTEAHLFRLPGDVSAFGHRCEAVAVLCVSIADREDLMPLAERFKKALPERAPVEFDEEDALYVVRE